MLILTPIAHGARRLTYSRFMIPSYPSRHRGKTTMKRTWSPDELAAHWVLTDPERQLLPDRVDHNRLGFAVHLKFFELEGRFPESPRDIPAAALNALATQLQIPSTTLARYDWHGRARKHHRAQLRAWFGFRPFTSADGQALKAWLHQEVLPWASPSNRSRIQDVTGAAISIWNHPPLAG